MIGTIYNYFKIKRLLNKIYASEKIEENLSRTFGVECKRDWVGRLYMIVNPILQNIKSDGNTIVYDHNDRMMVEAWVMKNLELIRNFIVNNSMFDLLTYTIDKIDNDENYLIVFKNIYFDDIMKICKWVAGIIGVGILVGIGFLIF